MKLKYFIVLSILLLVLFNYCGSSDANESDDTSTSKDADSKIVSPNKTVKNKEDNNTKENKEDGIIIENLNTPESIIYYEKEDCFFVSNINGSPVDKDENGFISKISLDGKMIEKNFIPFNDEKLNAPKGMAIKNNYLFIADLESVKIFDLNNKKMSKEIDLKEYGAVFLNDVLIVENTKYWNENIILVSDSMASKIFILSLDKQSYIGTLDNIKGANGICQNPIDKEIFVVSQTAGTIFKIDSKTSVTTWIDKSLGNLDGAFFDSNGNLFISDWKEGKIIKIGKDKNISLFKDNLPSPADFYIYEKNGKIYFLIPLFKLNKVKIIS